MHALFPCDLCTMQFFSAQSFVRQNTEKSYACMIFKTRCTISHNTEVLSNLVATNAMCLQTVFGVPLTLHADRKGRALECGAENSHGTLLSRTVLVWTALKENVKRNQKCWLLHQNTRWEQIFQRGHLFPVVKRGKFSLLGAFWDRK